MWHKIWWPGGNGEDSTPSLFDRSPFLWAVLCGRQHTFEHIHKKIDKDTRSEDQFGYSAMILAACGGHVEILKFLMAKTHRLDHPDKNGWTPFWYASRYSRLDVMKLPEPYVNIITADKHGVTPLAVAACYGCTKAVKFLLNLKRDPWCIIDSEFGRPENLERAPLVQAALGGSTGCLKLLLADHRRNWFFQDEPIQRILKVASRDRNEDLRDAVDLCLNHGSALPLSVQKARFLK